MSGDETYTLEYWIELAQFSEEDLENHVRKSLNRFPTNVNFDIQKNERYLTLCIVSTEKIIDACYEKLEFDGEWSFRAKDELGTLLRSRAYPILAEIELQLRSFISQGMIEALGFDWWNSFSPRSIQESAKKIEAKTGKNQAKLHHQIEFTFFDELIKIITGQFQAWTDERVITVADFDELLTKSNSIEDIKLGVRNRRKIVSFWDDVFVKYFDDKDAWIQLKKSIEETILPIRNQVMHHRLIRCHELRKLEAFRDEVRRVIGLAKTTLSDADSAENQESIKIITDELKLRANPTAAELERIRKQIEAANPTAAELERIRKQIEAANPTAAELERIRKQIEAANPTAAELERIRKQIEAANPTAAELERIRKQIEAANPTAAELERIRKQIEAANPIAAELERIRKWKLSEIESPTHSEGEDGDEDDTKAENETIEHDSDGASQKNDEDDSSD